MRSGNNRENTQHGTTTKGILCLTAVSTIAPGGEKKMSQTLCQCLLPTTKISLTYQWLHQGARQQ